MPNIKSAAKRVRQSERRAARNRVIKARVKTLRRELTELAESGKAQEAGETFKLYASAVDKAAKNNVFHQNKAANLKSKANKLIKASA